MIKTNGRELIVKTAIVSVIVVILKGRWMIVKFLSLIKENVTNVVLVERFVIDANTDNRIK